MPRAQWKVGILGAGYIADWHVKGLRTLRNVELVAVCDQNQTRAAEFAARHRIPAVHASLDAWLAADRPDVVHVLLPPDHHFSATARLLDAGVHVFLEKPMCARAEDCHTLAEQARRANRSLGVNHNFLFYPVYEQLRDDLARDRLGPVDSVEIVWNKELGQLRTGPFGGWMLREPGNLVLEIGPHSAAHLLDLFGPPDRLAAEADRAIDLANGVRMPRRWRVWGTCGAVGFEMRFSFAAGFPEHFLHVRGAAGSATVDFDRNTYVLRRQTALPDDFDRYRRTVGEGSAFRRQARRTLTRYVLSKFRLSRQGNVYGLSITLSMQRFYEGLQGALDPRISADFAEGVIEACERTTRAAGLGPGTGTAVPRPAVAPTVPPTVLVLGGSGFIGQALVRQLVETGHGVRLLVRDPVNLPRSLQGLPLEAVGGDVTRPADLQRAVQGVNTVYHLARAHAKTWDEYTRLDIEATRQVGEACLAQGVRRLIYTGTIDSYYSGQSSLVIDEQTPLDPRIHRRNLYARAKAEGERLLQEMHRERGLPLVIFRPGVVLGRGGSPFHFGVGMWAANSICTFWGDGRNPLPIVLVEDVARAMVRALDAEGIDGESFNLVGDPCLSAREYVAELEKAARTAIESRPRAAWRYYAADMFKWVVKCLVRHPNRRLPSYRDWESRSHRARFDCSKAKQRLGWLPTADRETVTRVGIVEPALEWMA